MEKQKKDHRGISVKMNRVLIKHFKQNTRITHVYREQKKKVIDMAMNGSGVRDTGRVLGISKDTVTSVLKKRESVEYVNYEYMKKYEENEIDVNICSLPETEMDEMWSFCHDKSHQVWLL